ncbi:MAG: UDP-N-acetylmuramoyl-L-alanyl-D-glutamate--2,6-diaminopimelate ligase [Gammaproteobacteria bacterium]|nr:UDP-N-acetylmuramoyl-L-alanyl-D-glutamate--2,6-diaminopimelate ligase [Gammaproteobacteria bacterium]
MVDLAQLLAPLALPFTVPALPVNQLQRDSRRISAGDLFVAMAGHQADGRHFVDAAIVAGAAAVLIDGDSDSLCWREQVPLLTISGLAGYLPQLAARFYGQPGQQLQLVGITGTNGKTSTSHLCAQLSELLGEPAAVIGTLGSGRIGQLRDSLNTTPDAVELQQLLRQFADDGVRRVTMEVSSHGLVQGRVDGAPLRTAVFTNLTRDHLDYHGTMEAYRDAKRLLFRHREVNTAVLNVDDAEGRLLLTHVDSALAIIAFGEAACSEHAERFVSVRELQLLGDGIHGTLISEDSECPFFCPLLGRFNVSNLLAAVAVARSWGYALAAIAPQLARLKPVNGRMELFHRSGLPAMVVDYAHTPDALEQVLQAARGHCHGQLWCVFGCGGDRDRGKRPLMAAAAAAAADRLVVTADNPRSESFDQIVADMRPGWGEAQVTIVADRRQAIRDAFAAAAPEDLVLIAGKGHETYQIIGATRHSYSDRAVVQQLLEERT